MIFYALTSSVELSKISQVLVAQNFNNYSFIVLGVAFMLVGLGFKLSLVPFHSWVLDVYERTTALFAGFLAVVPKIAAFVVVLRFFEIFISVNDTYVQMILYIIAVLTMTVANLMALVQTDIKKMLAFSSISHVGFVLTAILIGSSQATSAIFLYWILFSMANIGVFAMLWVNRNKNLSINGYTHNSLETYIGFAKKSPTAAVVMALFLLSLAGIPPFSLFWGKFYLISAAVNMDYVYLALIMILNSAIGAYYYIKPIVYMFFKEPVQGDNSQILSNLTRTSKMVIIVFILLTMLSIFLVEPLIEFISYYVEMSGY